MSTSVSLSAYPPEMLAALDRARQFGPITIYSDNPAKDRLYFYGLFKALRRAGQGERCDGLTLTLSRPKEAPALIIAPRSSTALSNSLRVALGENSPPLRPATPAPLPTSPLNSSELAAAEALLQKLGF